MQPQGSVGAANSATCTYMNTSMLVLNYTLPGYPAASGNAGLLMNVSQGPCTLASGAVNPACCVGTV